MTEGTVVKWLVKEGDEVSSGTPIAEIETDKAVMEQESFEDGTVLKITVKEGVKVAVGALMMVTGEKGEDISAMLGGGEAKPAAAKGAAAPAAAKGAAPAAAAPAAAATPAAAAPAPVVDIVGPPPIDRVVASPLARKMAKDAGLDLAVVSGTGPNGRVVRRDIESVLTTAPAASAPAAAAKPAAAAVAPIVAEAERVALSGMRQTIARRLVESKTTIPHFQLTIDVRGERLLEAVARIKQNYPDAKVTVTHFLIKAMATTAMRHKAIRTQWGGDAVQILPGASISVAVAIEDGLVTPVLRDVHSKGVLRIAEELRELAGKARERKLSVADMSGGVQTLSNLGMFGIHQFNAIVNPPESSILAVGAMEDRPVVDNGAIVPGKVMTITMSADHRIIDGAVGAAYLQDLKKALEDPLMMLL
jgi:pyruvate dehydrogenase E2 component (dihydrolipoamide acetyltransferase)